MRESLPTVVLERARELRKRTTDAERLLWQLLRNRQIVGAKFRRQHPIPPYILDFYCHEHRLAVEIDGGQHNQPLGIKRDRRRTEFLEQQGIRVLRFWNHEVLSETEAVLQVIYDAIVGSVPHAEPHHCPHPNPLPEGEGIVSEEEFRWPQHILDLFPDRLVDSELGEIPAGWEVGCVSDGFDLTMGQSPPGDTYNEAGEGMPFYQGRADFGYRFPTRRVYCTAPTRIAKAGDTLISVRAPVGDINMASEDCAIGRGVAAARHKTGSRSYTYHFMYSLKEVFARFEAEGTVFGSIGKKDFHAIPCVLPPRDLILSFERRVSPLDSHIEVNERESRTLAALRDALLPKLISGELRVKDAERFLEERGL
jgi:very-short-patch-repair endonuclease